MPSYAYLSMELNCPSCATVIADMLWFQWGFCPGQLPRTEYTYHIGDPIVWKACKDGSIPAWTYFSDKDAGVDKYAGGNLGDPNFRDLIVRDNAQDWLADACRSCQQALGGGALEIHDGIIVRGWLYRPGELDNEVDIYLVGADKTFTPMAQWNNHAMRRVENC